MTSAARLGLLLRLLGVNAAAAAPPSPPPRSCAAGAVQLNVSLYSPDVKAYSSSKCRDVATCCAACAANASCGAFFAKLPEPDAAGAPPRMGTCNLYSLASAAQLQRGRCPGSTPHLCGSI